MSMPPQSAPTHHVPIASTTILLRNCRLVCLPLRETSHIHLIIHICILSSSNHDLPPWPTRQAAYNITGNVFIRSELVPFRAQQNCIYPTLSASFVVSLFYLVCIQGEVKDPEEGKCVTSHGLPNSREG